MAELIRLEPVIKDMIWGSETWTISAHPHGDCKVAAGEYQGMTLSQLWDTHPELFGAEPGSQFPLLIKIIDAKDDLSIQVHPDDGYAAEHEHGSLGKTECWYVLDCKEDAQIVIGHHAKDQAEMEQMIREKRWNAFIRVIPVRKGDFFQIDPGCLHAIKGGTLILETQQSSDITYRVYDYGRLSDGKPRELHIEQSMDVIQAPFTGHPAEQVVTQLAGAAKTHLVSCPFYTVERYEVAGTFCCEFPYGFTNVSIIEGSGTINGEKFEKGAGFIVPFGFGNCLFSGDFVMITSHSEKL